MTERGRRGAFARIAINCAVAATALACHAPTNAVPMLTVGAELGGGPRPTRVGQTYFRGDKSGGERLVATARVGRLGPVFPVVRIERNVFSIGTTDDCQIAPNGTCRQHFPDEYAFGVALGVAYPLTNRFAITGVIGRSYSLWSDPTRQFVNAQLSFAATRYFAVTASMRRSWWDDPEYGRLWHQPRTLGLRLQWP
jgi:hypothetical protein